MEAGMDTFIKLGSIVIGLIGAFLLLVTPAGWIFILLGLLIFVANNNARMREEERQWREEMLKK